MITKTHLYLKYFLLFLFLTPVLSYCQKTVNHRHEISLNGTWKIARTNSITEIPSAFVARIPVPGLVDMAEPKIENQDTAYIHSIYWYKRTFKLNDSKNEIIQLKINKSSYHTWVYLNSKLVGEQLYNFTPSLFNVKPFLKIGNEDNELLIAVGCRINLPDTVANGNDFEKTKYIPGIYDDVKLIQSGLPFISNIQTVPDIKNEQLRVVAEIQTPKTTAKTDVSYVVREAVSKKIITQGSFSNNKNRASLIQKVDFIVKMDECRLWTPETPFLYDLLLYTEGDHTSTRFGMRTFAGSKENGGIFLLNDKPYYLRGTNVCIFRFFEDPDRNGLPWNPRWVTKLHDRFKEMNWNSIRYCIGFPPEKWYEVADSLGLLIQDEFPIWTGLKGGFEKLQKGTTSKQLSVEYQAWMRERWNHPCVVIWDAQNESVNDTTAKAIRQVRALDLSNRPWDNGYAPPVSETDAIESHPYLFIRYVKDAVPSKNGYLKDLLSEIRNPDNGPNEYSPKPNGERYKNPVIANEYSWLWLNRDGTTTTLTDRVYEVAFPEAITATQKFEACAKNTAILTEYWRASRKCAGVMHFCGLGYSRSAKPRGQTSDNFIDLKNLIYEPHFLKYVKPAFSPVGLMVEMWDKVCSPGTDLSVPMHVFNDTDEDWNGTVKLTVSVGDEILQKQEVTVVLKKEEKKIFSQLIKLPQAKGNYQLQAEINYKGETVKSIRDFSVN